MPQTNMVFFDLPAAIAAPFAAHLASEVVRITGTARQRWVAHLDATAADVDAARAFAGCFFAP